MLLLRSGIFQPDNGSGTSPKANFSHSVFIGCVK